MKLMKKLQKKILSKKGFSLSELLVALIVVSIMTVALTAGVSASLRVYNDSVRHAEERALLSTLSEAVMSELRNARDPKSDAAGVVTFTSQNYGPRASFTVDDGKMKIAGKDLIGDGSYIKGKIKLDLGSDEQPPLTSITYDEGSGTFYVKLTCAGSGESREFSVRPMVDK